jgi:starch synthase
MIGCRYADVPLVRRTGGLGDTISDCTLSSSGNGFVFDQFTSDAFAATLKSAIDKYWDKADWAKLEQFDLGLDFGWDYSAERYIDLYKELED